MNAKQLAKLVSFVTTEKTLKNTTETSEIAGLPATLTELSAILGEINTLAATQNQLTEGKTARRDEMLAAMRELALEVANAVAAHADAQNLTEILPDVLVTPADFARQRIPERPLLAQRIHTAGVATLPQHPALPELKARIDAVREALTQPREAIAERRAATQQLAVLFDNADALLRRIDRMLFPLRKTSPQFYAKYLATRKAFGRSRANDDNEDDGPTKVTAPATPASAATANPSTPTQALAA